MNKPELYVAFFKAFWETASEPHKKYVGTDRPHGQAASFESLLVFKNEVLGTFEGASQGNSKSNKKILENVFILDAGAGVSSCMLRAWFDNVITCDPNKEYLEDVKKTCELMAVELNLPRLALGKWVHGYPPVGVHACFYDYGASERKPHLGLAMKHTQHLIYVDDADNREDCVEMRAFVHDTVKVANAELDEHSAWHAYDALDAEDEHSRWGMILNRY